MESTPHRFFSVNSKLKLKWKIVSKISGVLENEKIVALEETSEKQTPGAVLQKSCSDKFEKIPMKTPTIVCDFFLENFSNILE